MRRLDLVPACGDCAAICCVATSFDASEDFAITKSASERCPNLRTDCRCAIHGELAVRGFGGCAVYDCYGAGQRVSKAFPASLDARERDAAFLVMRVVHELLWLLTEAAKLCPSEPLVTELGREIEVLDAIEPQHAHDLELAARSRAAHALLRRVGDALVTRPGARAPGAGTSRGTGLLRVRSLRS